MTMIRPLPLSYRAAGTGAVVNVPTLYQSADAKEAYFRVNLGAESFVWPAFAGTSSAVQSMLQSIADNAEYAAYYKSKGFKDTDLARHRIALVDSMVLETTPGEPNEVKLVRPADASPALVERLGSFVFDRTATAAKRAQMYDAIHGVYAKHGFLNSKVQAVTSGRGFFLNQTSFPAAVRAECTKDIIDAIGACFTDKPAHYVTPANGSDFAVMAGRSAACRIGGGTIRVAYFQDVAYFPYDGDPMFSGIDIGDGGGGGVNVNLAWTNPTGIGNQAPTNVAFTVSTPFAMLVAMGASAAYASKPASMPQAFWDQYNVNVKLGFSNITGAMVSDDDTTGPWRNTPSNRQPFYLTTQVDDIAHRAFHIDRSRLAGLGGYLAHETSHWNMFYHPTVNPAGTLLPYAQPLKGVLRVVAPKYANEVLLRVNLLFGSTYDGVPSLEITAVSQHVEFYGQELRSFMVFMRDRGLVSEVEANKSLASTEKAGDATFRASWFATPLTAPADCVRKTKLADECSDADVDLYAEKLADGVTFKQAQNRVNGLAPQDIWGVVEDDSVGAAEFVPLALRPYIGAKGVYVSKTATGSWKLCDANLLSLVEVVIDDAAAMVVNGTPLIQGVSSVEAMNAELLEIMGKDLTFEDFSSVYNGAVGGGWKDLDPKVFTKGGYARPDLLSGDALLRAWIVLKGAGDSGLAEMTRAIFYTNALMVTTLSS